MKNKIKRAYSERGTRRTYTGVRIDVETLDKLQKLSELWKTSIIQVVDRLVTERLENEEKQTF